MQSLFKLRGELDRRTNLLLQIAGILFLLLFWYVLTMGLEPLVRSSLLPSPGSVLSAYPEMISENQLWGNLAKSISLNIAGYIEAIVIAIPIGFIIGLFPLFRGLFQRPIDAFRYIPLTAVTGLFIVWFGLKSTMKVHFLAFGILIYLLPVVVQRINEVKDVFTKTVYTLGASKWQTIWNVYVPSVISRLSDDIRVLTAISWTYIIIAESLGNQGGIGALIWRSGLRQGRVDKVFGILLLIIVIGVIQDKLLVSADKKIFPFKYPQKEKVETPIQSMLGFATMVFTWSVLGIYLVLALNELFHFISGQNILRDLFGGSVWAIHILFLSLLFYNIFKRLKK